MLSFSLYEFRKYLLTLNKLRIIPNQHDMNRRTSDCVKITLLLFSHQSATDQQMATEIFSLVANIFKYRF